MLDIIFPKIDINSKEIGKYIKTYNFKTHDEICYKCKKYSQNFLTHKSCGNIIEKVVTCFYYTENIKKYILNFKYYHKKELLQEIGQIMKYFYEIYFYNLDKEKTILTFVPMHWFRKHFIKGYNQGEILTKILAKNLGLKYAKICKKSKYTKPQAKIKLRQQRFKNLNNSFKLDINFPKDIKNIVIIDDIITTGATIEEVAKCIKINHPKIHVYALILARK